MKPVLYPTLILSLLSSVVLSSSTIYYINSACPPAGSGDGSQASPFCDFGVAFAAAEAASTSSSSITLMVDGNWNITSTYSTIFALGTTLSFITSGTSSIMYVS